MSGGTFDYRQFRLEELASDIEYTTKETLINPDPELTKYGKRLANRLRKLAKEIHKLDYYLSGDSSDYK